jgi:hypothetical protein
VVPADRVLRTGASVALYHVRHMFRGGWRGIEGIHLFLTGQKGKRQNRDSIQDPVLNYDNIDERCNSEEAAEGGS